MNSWKKLAALALCLALICSLLPQVSLTAHAETVSGTYEDNVSWTLDTETGLLTIEGSGTIGSDYDTCEDLPWRSEELSSSVKHVEIKEGITGTGGGTFSYCGELESVSLPESLTDVGMFAFAGCSALTGLAIPKNVTSIGDFALFDCNSLSTIDVDPENQSYSSEDGVLFNKEKTELVRYPAGKLETNYSIPDGVNMVAFNAFDGCGRLFHVTIPDSVKTLGERAFRDCTSMQTVTIGNGVREISVEAFSGCTMLMAPEFGSNVKTISAMAFFGCTLLADLTIPDSVTLIDYAAFANCSALTNLTLGSGVTYVGGWAFGDCTSLTDVTIPKNVMQIEYQAFGYYWGEDWDTLKVDGFTIHGYSGTAAERYANDNGFNFEPLQEPVVTSGVCGAEGDNLTWNFDEESGVLTISGSGAMADCEREVKVPWRGLVEKITAVELPDGMTHLGDYAFKGCTKLTGIELPAGLTSIGGCAFCDCTALTAVTVPSGVNEIDWAAFSGCTALTNVSLPETLTTLEPGAFEGCIALTAIVLPDNLTETSYSLFADCFNLAEVSFPKQLTMIGSMSFAGCKALTSLSLPDSVREIGWAAFEGCTGLTSLAFPANLKEIRDSAFEGCTGLTALTFPAGLKTIEDGAFRGCTALAEVELPNGLNWLGAMVFMNTALRSVTLPVSLSVANFQCVGYTENSETYEFEPVEGFVVYGVKGSVAELYATEYELRFVPVQAENPFADVAESDYFFVPTLWGFTNGITAGVAPGQFGPNDSCTREQIVTFLWAANGKPEPETTESPFSDVASDAWYFKPVMWAAENGITSGMGDGSFGVGQPCTRAQAMTFLWASQNHPWPYSTSYPDSPFSDVSSDDWYYRAVLWAYKEGVTAGMGDGSFGAYSSCTRGQIMTFLYKAMSMVYSYLA